MAGPWERFQAASEGTGPWAKFKAPAKPEEWERAVLLPMETNKDTGERRLAWPQLAVDAGNLFMAPGNAVQGKYDTVQIDPATGQPEPFSRDMVADAAGLAGLVSPASPVGGIMRLAVPGAKASLPGPTRSMLARALKDDKIPVAEIGARLEELGPDAVLADLGPRLTKQAQAIATMPGPGQRTVLDTLRARAFERNERLAGDVDNTLGPAPVPSAVQSSIRQGKDALSPYYKRAMEGAGRVDTSPIALDLDSLVVNKRGEAQAVAKKLRGMLNVVGTEELDPSPQTLFEVRNAIDGMFETVTDTKALGVLTETRRKVDDLLAQAAPGIKEIDSMFSELARQATALDEGGMTLATGKEARHPSDVVEQMLSGAVPPGPVGIGPSAVPFRLSQGARAEIDRLIGTKANDLQALKQAVGGEGDWNREKLSAIFGPEKADNLLSIIARELRYKVLEDDALAGSRTQVLKAAQEEVAGKEPKEGILRSVLNLKAGDAASAGADKTLGWISRANRERVNAALAGALMGTDAGVLEQQLARSIGGVAAPTINATARAALVRMLQEE
jgi:hypothetical protein